MCYYFLLLLLDLAQAVVDTGAVPLLVLCIQEPEIALKRIAASALSDISKHSPEVCEQYVCTSPHVIFQLSFCITLRKVWSTGRNIGCLNELS